jgi:hypothetical protein
MTAKLMSTENQNFQILIHCPTTGEQVLGNNLTHFSIQNRKAAWWCCPACYGWHVFVYEDEKEVSEELYDSKVKQFCLTSA